MSGLAAVLIGGSPATGKSTLGAALVAPFTAERAQPPAWAAVADRLAAVSTMVWLHLAPDELVRRLALRSLARDETKIADPAAFLTGLDLGPPAVPHLALDAGRPVGSLVRSVLDHLAR